MTERNRKWTVAILATCLSVFYLKISAAQAVVLKTRHKFVPARHLKAQKPAAVDSDQEAETQEPAPGRARQGMSLSPEGLARQISARSAIILDAKTMNVLFAQDPDEARQPASTIKVLTGLIAIDSLRDGEPVPVSPRAAQMPASKVYLRAGKTYPADDLVNAVLLASANDASVALAEKVAGSEPLFAKLMTAKAANLGASNTVCKTANGLTAPGQHSTARDLAMIFNRAMENRDFADKMARQKIQTRDGRFVYSHNKALWRVEGTQGGKTGYTVAARKTYVGKFKREEGEIVVAMMGSERMWIDLARLVEYGFAKKRILASATAQADIPFGLAARFPEATPSRLEALSLSLN